MNKIVAIQDSRGNQEHFDISQIKARELNKWNGWICSAGTKVIHIDRDGDVWAGTCKVGGKLGDIYTGWKSVPGWITCTANRCNCGTQIKIPKYKPGHHDDWANKTIGETGLLDTQDQVFVDATYGELDIHVQWSLGRRCNYDCSYCPGGARGIHNDFEPHKPLDVLIRTVDQLHEWAGGKPLLFCFSGGEPTIHPGFIDLCKHIKTLGHKVHLTTNGSHGPNHWKKLCEVIDWALVSVHYEFASLPILMKNLEVMKDHKKLVNPHFGVGVQIMTKPEDFDKSRELIQMMRDSDPDFFKYVEVSLTALRVMLGVIQDLMDYTPDQIAEFGVVS
jgi:organic radical activating enzyme